MAPPGLATWARAQRTLQPFEAWQTFQDWIERANPRFQFSVARNLFQGAPIPAAERAWASLVREEARGRMRQLLPPGTILCLPTTPFPAPLLRPASFGDRRPARPHHRPVRAWRADRGAAGQPAGRDGRRSAGRAVDRRAARRRRSPRRRRARTRRDRAAPGSGQAPPGGGERRIGTGARVDAAPVDCSRDRGCSCCATIAGDASEASPLRASTRAISLSAGASSHSPVNGTPAPAATAAKARRSSSRSATASITAA